MRIEELNVFEFDLPLRQKITARGKESLSRRGYIIQIMNQQNISGFGEISPLLGFSRENINEAKNQVIDLAQELRGKEIPSDVFHLQGKFEDWLGPLFLVSSVRCGVEMAVLNLLANSKKIPLNQLLSKTPQAQVPICGLVEGERQDIMLQAKDLLARGFKAVKLKVGRKPLEEDIRTVQELNQILENHALLRLDANQNWDINKAVTFGNEVGCAAVEYIEEPIADRTQLEEFFMKTTIPVALDESLLKIDFQEVKSLAGVDVLILKPTVLGGIEKTWEWIEDAHRFGLQCVVSSSFETGVGIKTLADFTSLIPHVTPAGFDTLKWFTNDIVKEPINFEKGLYKVHKPIQSLNELDSTYLKKIS